MSMEKMKELLVTLCTQRDSIKAETGPLREKRRQLAERIAPIEAQIYELDQQIKAAEQPALHECEKAIAAIEAATQ